MGARRGIPAGNHVQRSRTGRPQPHSGRLRINRPVARSGHEGRRGILAVALSVMAVLAASGCTGIPDQIVEGNASVPAADVEPVTRESTTTTTAPVGSFEAAGTWSWEFHTEDGYVTEGTLELGELTTAPDAVTLPGFTDSGVTETLEASCDGFDPETDALIPARQTLGNGSDGFDASVSNSFFLAIDDPDAVLSVRSVGDELAVAASYSDHLSCNALGTADDVFFGSGSSWGLSFEDPVAPGDTVGPHYAYLILPDYYTPARPTGDTSRLESVGLGLVSAMRSDDAELILLEGPDSSWGSMGGAFTLSAVAAHGVDAGRSPVTSPETTVPDQPDGTSTTEPIDPTTSTGPVDLGEDGCPAPPSGEWSGTWNSDMIDISGTATATVQVDGSTLSGSLELRGPADVYLVDSGPISGSVDCLDMALSVADDTLSLQGSMTPDRRTFSGTYDARLNSDTIMDYGTFTLELRP